MLRLSKLADYGTVVMVYLARHQQEYANAREVALGTHVTVPTVSKLLKILANQGLLESRRGTKGGYKLALSAGNISVADIINALEDRTGLTECSHQDDICSLNAVCEVRENWRILNYALEHALESVSLEALSQPKFNTQQVDVSRILRLAKNVE